MKTLLLGLGNPILTDDAVGLRLAADLGQRFAGRPGLDVLADCPAGGLALLDLITGYDRLVVFDALRADGLAPGEWCRFTAAALRPTAHLSSVHDASFATVLALGRRLGERLPRDEEIHVFAVQVADDATFGEGLSPAVTAAYPRVREEMARALGVLLGRRRVATRPGRGSGRGGSRN